MKKILPFMFLLAIVISTGCTTSQPIDYFSTTPDDARTQKIHFSSSTLGHVIVSMFANPYDCSNKQLLKFISGDVNQTVYIPRSDYLTFEAMVNYNKNHEHRYARVIHSIPVNDADIRVHITENDNIIYVYIEHYDLDKGWVKTEGSFERNGLAGMWMSRAWCTPDDRISSPNIEGNSQ